MAQESDPQSTLNPPTSENTGFHSSFYETKKRGKPFTGTAEHLAKRPPWRGGLTADEIIRADRDSLP
jgi:hypothetical protein